MTRAGSPPALLPALGIALGVAGCWHLPIAAPVGAGALLALAGIALGGARGPLLCAVGVGALAAATARDLDSTWFSRDGRVAQLEGRICSHPRRYPEGGASVDLCARTLRRGGEVLTGRWEVRLDLAPGVPPPALGALVRARGSPARAPGYDNAFRSRPGRWALRIKASPFLRTLEPAPTALRWLGGLRRRLELVWGDEARVHSPGEALARALVLGDAAAMPPSWQRGLRRAGLAHLVAVSGFNVAMVAGVVLLATSLLPRSLALLASAAAAALYLGLVGPEPSLLRATWMALAAVAALFSRRSPSALNALAAVAAGMILQRPAVVEEVGFGLSVAATGGLLLLAPALARRLPGRRPTLRLALAASLGAQIAATPLSLAAFGRVSLLAPVLNLVFVPASVLGLVAALMQGALGIAGWSTATTWIRPVLEACALPFRALDWLPVSSLVSLAAPPVLLLGGVLALFAWTLLVAPTSRRPAALALLLMALSDHGRHEGGLVEITLLDVGQGEAILATDGEVALLVDGGGARGRDLATAVLLPALARRGIERLRAVVLTHADNDHCGGLADLIGWIEVEEIWLPAGLGRSSCADEIRRWAPVRWLQRGSRVAVGSLEAQVLHPGPEGGRDDNGVSLVVDLRSRGRRVLLTGDLDARGERAIVSGLVDRSRVDLLKVAHHGSRGSTTMAFLESFRPRLALVSAGPGNPFGHPSEETLARLATRGIPILRTDRDGEISIRWRERGPLEIDLPGSPRRSWFPAPR